MSKPTADDRARVALTEQFGRKEPKASKDTYTEQEWKDTFERPWIIPNKWYLSDGGGDAYCRICVVEKKHGKLATYRLHIAYEDDVMQVSKNGLIHATCHSCGFDMHAPRKPLARRKDFEAIFDEYAKIDPKAMDDLIQRSLAQKNATATEIQIRQQEAMRRMGQMMAPAEAEQRRLDALRRAQIDAAKLGALPPIMYRDPLDPNKWPYP